MRLPSRKAIRGAGGKGGGGAAPSRAPVESPDSLRSRQFAQIIDLVSEGEIGGLVAGAQSIYLDGVPLANPDGSYNFTGVSVDWRTGTQGQAYLPGVPSSQNEVSVGVEVTKASPVVRQITNGNVNAAVVTIAVPQLTHQNSTNGDLSGASVQLAFDVQANGGGFVQQLVDTISGKTTTRYNRSYRFALAGSPPWDIRVRRITDDSVTVNHVDKTYWTSFTEVIDEKLTYPNSAVVSLEVDSQQFTGIPTRGYEAFGILCQVPSNYNPSTRAYTGVWDGTFQVAWTDNPAWCFYDMITQSRYGLGDFIDGTWADKWALYEIGQYCDELVSDGFGGQEPRFTCNIYLQTREEAYTVINNMASIFRGMAYWLAGTITATVDAPTEALALFTRANVVDGNFEYQGSARNARHTVVLVAWNDPDDAYRQRYEAVEDQTGIARYGIVQSAIVAFGCTSRGQAHRLGRWLLYSERLETETVTFRVSLEGSFVYPGAVIKINDPTRAGVRFGGRIVSATVSAVTIDAAVTIEVGKTYTIDVISPDGSIVSRDVTNAPGSATVLTVSPNFAVAPQAQAAWVLASNDLEPELWRVISISQPEKNLLEVTALEYNPDKFAAVEEDLILEPRRTSSVDSRPDPVTNLTATESLVQTGPNIVSNRTTLSWTGTTGRYLVSYRAATGNWVTLPETVSQTVDLDGLEPGIYTFNVQQLNVLSIPSLPATLVQELYGKTAPPANLTGFTVAKVGGVGVAQWTPAVDLDVQIGGSIVIRHSMLTTGALWNDSVVIAVAPGNVETWDVDLVTGTYFAKAVDSSGNYSVTEASFVATEGMVTGFNLVTSTTQHPTFTGAKSNVALVGSGIQLDSASLIDSMSTLVDSWPLLDAIGGVSATGTYFFDTHVDCTTVATRRLESDIQVNQFDTGDLIDSRLENIDDWDSFDGSVINDCDVVLYVRATDDNPAGSPTWGPWIPYRVADVTGRAYQHKLEFIAGSAQHNISVTTLKVDFKTPVSP